MEMDGYGRIHPSPSPFRHGESRPKPELFLFFAVSAHPKDINQNAIIISKRMKNLVEGQPKLVTAGHDRHDIHRVTP